jgi:hypothetical protein
VRDKLKHEFDDRGERVLKNIARPMRIYALKSGSDSVAPALSVSAPNVQGPPHLSIVVLPFVNMTGDPEQEYFVDGVTESLTTDLSRIGGSFVIEPLPAASSKAASIPQMRRMRTELREPPRADSLKRTLRDPAANLIDLTADHAQYDP